MQKRRALQMADAVLGPGSNVARLLSSPPMSAAPPGPTVESPFESSSSAVSPAESPKGPPKGLSPLTRAVSASDGLSIAPVGSWPKDLLDSAMSSNDGSCKELVTAMSSNNSLSRPSYWRERGASDSCGECEDQEAIVLDPTEVDFKRSAPASPVDVYSPRSRSSLPDMKAFPRASQGEVLTVNALPQGAAALMRSHSSSGRYSPPAPVDPHALASHSSA